MRVALTVLLLLAGCDGGTTPPPSGTLPDAGPGGVYIALTRDFEDFRDWQSFAIEDPTAPAAHPPGPSRVYINAMPPEGLRRFPVGTILVKTIENGAPQDWAIHAFVKRGGDFGEGLVGWELFELRFDEDERPIILWRGAGPPSGQGYLAPVDGGSVELVCRDCHAAGWQNDSVLNPFTRLSY
ncbi:MAG: hypothetical protein H6719_31300 [Sandaracinaceae bacterium]|nr:hypothetical protein [Sandaracinaceae bacterium]